MLLLNCIIYFSLSLIISVAVPSSCRMASQKGPPEKAETSVKNAQSKDVQELQTQIKEFLNSWLVDHELKNAQGFFSAQATSNEVLLHADCGGYIKDEERKSRHAVQAGLEKFLRDFATGEKYRDLNQQLDASRFIQASLVKGAVNDVKRDKYLLVKLSSNDLGKLVDNSGVIDSLRSKLKNDHFYFSLISVKGGMFYFLWVKESAHWRIYHADMICI